jgi:hypothetical protein
MMPYTIALYLLAAGLAIYGVHKRGSLTRIDNKTEELEDNRTTGTLFKQSIPAIALLVMVVAGGKLNSLIGINFFSPAMAVIITSILTVLLTPLNINETGDALIEGSRFILTTLFAVGMFLAAINLIAELGTFAQLAAIASKVPEAIILPTAIIIAFLIAIPSGAFAAGVLTLILPTLSVLGLPSEAMGFVAIATGLGTQLSPVQINVAALSKGFEIEIIDVIKTNVKYILATLVLVIIIAVIVV